MHLGTVDTGTSDMTRAMSMLTANCNVGGLNFGGPSGSTPFTEDAGNSVTGVFNGSGTVSRAIVVWSVSASAGVAMDPATGSFGQAAIIVQTTGGAYRRSLAQIAAVGAAAQDINDTTSFTIPGILIPANLQIIFAWDNLAGTAQILPLATLYYTVV